MVQPCFASKWHGQKLLYVVSVDLEELTKCFYHLIVKQVWSSQRLALCQKCIHNKTISHSLYKQHKAYNHTCFAPCNFYNKHIHVPIKLSKTK